MHDARFSTTQPWHVTTLGDVVVKGDLDIEIGARFSSSQMTENESGEPVIMPENIRNHKISPDGIARVRPDAVSNAGRFRVRRGDIVCSRRGDLTRYALVDSHCEGWLCGNGCLRLRFRSEALDPRFAFYYFRQPWVATWLKSRAVGSTIPHINRRAIAKMPLSIPPYHEQRDIADLLGVIEQKLEQNSALRTDMLELARLYLQRSLKGISPMQVEDAMRPDTLPDGFRLGTLSDCCRRIEIGGTPGDEYDVEKDATIPWLVSEEVRNGIIISAKKHLTRSTLVTAGLKLWPRGTTIVALFGAPAGSAAWLDVDASANQACCGLVPADDFCAFNFLYLSSIGARLKQMRQGSKQQNLNKKLLEELTVLIPPHSMLRKIESEVRPLLEQMAAISWQSTSLAILRDAFLPQLVMGRWRFNQNKSHKSQHK